MKLVLLSGVSGWRLWPLSNESRSKQFLKLLNREDGSKESMVQRIFRQIDEAELVSLDDIFFVTAGSQADSIRNQIGPEVNIIIEPERRNTFPAVSVAAACLTLDKKISLNETVIVLPVDTFATSDYFRLLFEMDRKVQNDESDIVLMGTIPTYPSAKYGYLQADSEGRVTNFLEKPTEEKAEELISQGAYWNAGVFAFKLGHMIDIMRKYLPDDAFHDMNSFLRVFTNLPKESMDREVIEHSSKMSVVIYPGKWKDMGTWNTLTEEMEDQNIGQSTQGEECHNTHVINELSIPVLVLGAQNMVVAASPDGILVSDKHKSSYIKPYVQQLDARPMYEERKWGEYKVLDYNQYEDGMKSLTKHLTISAGKAISYQKHLQRDEIWTIVDGTGQLLIDGQIRHVKRGDVAYIVKGQKHALRADEVDNLQFIEVQIGPELAEEDIERFDWTWE